MGFFDWFGTKRKKRKRFIFTLDAILWRLNQVMGRLDVIKAELDKAASTAADEAAQVAAHLDALRGQVSTLQETIDGLVANQVTDAEIEALRAQAATLSDTVEAIDTEGDVVPEPTPEPTPEPAPEPAPEEPPVV